MSGFGDKLKGFFNMDAGYDDDYDEYDDYDDDYDTEEVSVRPSRQEKKKTTARTSSREVKDTRDYSSLEDELEERTPKTSRRSTRQSKVVPMSSTRSRNIKAEIFTIKPTSLEDSKEIVDTLLEGKAIIINFEGTNTDLAQRIIDSISGACCAVDGTLKKISAYIYIVSPVTIELYGEYFDSSSSNSYDFKGNRYQY